MIERAIAAGIPFGWVTADEAYGDNGPLRAFLEEQQASYVLAVSRDHVITTAAGRRRADALAPVLPKRAWQRVSCGESAKGRRFCDRALIATSRPEISLLIRRSSTRPSELAFYLCHTPQPVPLAVLVKVAGARWSVEVGHRWCRSSYFAFSWLCSLFLVGLVFLLCPAGPGVVAGRACPALA
jgi:SRSO17 transposase